MRTFDIDFLHPTSPWTHGRVLLSLGLLVAALTLWQFKVLSDRTTSAQQLIVAQANAQSANKALSSIVTPSYADDPRWKHAAQELDYPWIDTLQALENATTPPIYLISMQTDTGTGIIRLEAEAPKYDDALTYLGPLQQSPHFASVRLLSHDTTQDIGGRSFVRAVIETKWVTN